MDVVPKRTQMLHIALAYDGSTRCIGMRWHWWGNPRGAVDGHRMTDLRPEAEEELYGWLLDLAGELVEKGLAAGRHYSPLRPEEKPPPDGEDGGY